MWVRKRWVKKKVFRVVLRMRRGAVAWRCLKNWGRGMVLVGWLGCW